MEKKHRHILLPFDSIHSHMDWVEGYISHIEYSRRNVSSHEQWKLAKKANFQEKLLTNISCTRWPLWRKSTHLDVCFHLHFLMPFFIQLHPLSGTCGRELIHWSCTLVPCLGDHKIYIGEKDSWMEKYRHILLPFDAIHPHMDWVEYYMSHMESPCRKKLCS